jgi:hypothetical protein
MTTCRLLSGGVGGLVFSMREAWRHPHRSGIVSEDDRLRQKGERVDLQGFGKGVERTDVTRRITQVRDVLSQELDGQTLLLAPGRQEALHLDEVATTVWQLLATAPTLDELVEAMSEVYGVPAQRISQDISPVLEQLTTHGQRAVSSCAAPCGCWTA